MSHHVTSWQSNVGIFAALLILLVATLGCAYLPLGVLHFPVAMAIATAKAYLIVMYFMHVRFSHRLTAIVLVSRVLLARDHARADLERLRYARQPGHPGEVRIAGRRWPRLESVIASRRPAWQTRWARSR